MERPKLHRVRYARPCDKAYVESLSALGRSLFQACLLEKCKLQGPLSVGFQRTPHFNQTVVVHWTHMGGVLVVNAIEDYGFQAMHLAITDEIR
jgi:hypothetical protein